MVAALSPHGCLHVTDADRMHQHRRQDDSDDLRGHRMEAAAESTMAKFFARIVTPAMLALTMALCGWIGTRLISQMDDQGRDLDAVKSDVRDLNTRMTEGVIRQVNSNSSRIDDHEKRLQVLERTVKTP